MSWAYANDSDAFADLPLYGYAIYATKLTDGQGM